MKRLALILALLTICSLFVACDNTQPVNSEPAASEPAASTPAVSETESISEPPTSEPEVSEVPPEPTLLYVNAIDGVINNSISGLYAESLSPFTEGAGCIITAKFTGAIPGFNWAGVAIFKPTEEEGVYEVVYSAPSTGDAKPATDLVIPEGGFIYSANSGNNWPQLVLDNADLIAQIDAGTATNSLWWYPQNKDFPNYTTPNISASVTAAGSLYVGAKATLVNIDLTESVIQADFGSYISVINTVEY